MTQWSEQQLRGKDGESNSLEGKVIAKWREQQLRRKGNYSMERAIVEKESNDSMKRAIVEKKR